MESRITLFALLLLSSSLFAQDFPPQSTATLHSHLIAINSIWKKVELEGTRSAYSFNQESQRIKMHLSLVEETLRQNPPIGIDDQQLKLRNKSLDNLKAYYQAGRFPINSYHKERSPYFIDHYGTACAVGHLIIESGNAELALTISKENNYSYISDLNSKYPLLAQWANQNGFTIQELAWIQPGYPPINQEWNQVGYGGGCDGQINVMDADHSYGLYLAGFFSEVDGVAANNIIGWDGEEWFTLGNGVNGEIYDLQVLNTGKIIIAGDFQVYDNPSIINLAYWEDGLWKGFETSNMTGSIYTISASYIGGDFEVNGQNGESIKYLATFDFDEPYLSNYNHALSVDQPVYAIDWYNGNVLVGGSFTKTAVSTNDTTINQFNCNHLAYWNHINSNWFVGFDHPFNPITSLNVNAGKIYTGSSTNLFPYASLYDAGLWNAIPEFVILNENSGEIVQGIYSHNGRVFYYGNLSFLPLIGTISNGIYVVGSDEITFFEEGADFDASVNAMTYWQGQYYFAGDFTEVQGQSFAGLVSSPFDASTPLGEIESQNQFDVFSSIGQVQIQYQGLVENCLINFYNMEGKLMATKELIAGDAELSLSTQEWSSGIYFYSASTGSEIGFTGKVSILK